MSRASASWTWTRHFTSRSCRVSACCGFKGTTTWWTGSSGSCSGRKGGQSWSRSGSRCRRDGHGHDRRLGTCPALAFALGGEPGDAAQRRGRSAAGADAGADAVSGEGTAHGGPGIAVGAAADGPRVLLARAARTAGVVGGVAGVGAGDRGGVSLDRGRAGVGGG